MNKYLYAPFVLLLLVLFTGCSNDRDPGPATRVWLVYIGTDNNLSGYEEEKLRALQAGWTGESTDHLLAYVDNTAEGAVLYNLSVPANHRPATLAHYGKENSASANVFSRVITDVRNRYPDADSFGLLVFSHASGWLPKGALNSTPTRSVITDGTSEMQLSDFAAAIPNGMFDYMVFETCFMAGIEVAYELRHKTNYILASSAEIIHPGFAPIYATSTPMLFAGDLQGFGRAAFDHTLTYAEDNLNRSATYSVIRTAGLEPLATFIRENCDMNQNVDVAHLQSFDRLTGYSLFFDFENFYSKLCIDASQRAELSRLVGQCVVWKAATPEFMTQESGYNGFAINTHSGLTTYVRQPSLAGLNATYANLEWVKALE